MIASAEGAACRRSLLAGSAFASLLAILGCTDSGDSATKPCTLNRVPRTSCSTEGERCTAAETTYCKDGRLGRVDGVTCDCRSGSWSCEVTSPGGGVCPSEVDASDAATD